jgi:hypothetical protein
VWQGAGVGQDSCFISQQVKGSSTAVADWLQCSLTFRVGLDGPHIDTTQGMGMCGMFEMLLLLVTKVIFFSLLGSRYESHCADGSVFLWQPDLRTVIHYIEDYFRFGLRIFSHLNVNHLISRPSWTHVPVSFFYEMKQLESGITDASGLSCRLS